MTKRPRLTGKKILAALKRAGFEAIRVRGSLHFPQHKDGRRTVVPLHAGESIGPGLFSKILRDCEMTNEDLMSFL